MYNFTLSGETYSWVCNPFEQFEIEKYVERYCDYFLTDTTFLCLIFIFSIQLMTVGSVLKNSFFDDRNQTQFFALLYSIYKFIYQMLYSYIEEKTDFYFPFFFYLFFFFTIINIVGILPFSFTVFSHLNLTFTMSFFIWWSIVLLGFYSYGLHFFEFFFAEGVPFRLVPFLALIELISFLFRSVSLALRLFANLVAGHILLDTVSLFIYNILQPSIVNFNGIFISILPIFLCFVLVCFECVVAVLQAYIFVILSIIYLKDIYAFH
uniref:ATP synthase subunit a n=1 Tax=Pleurostomum flabellatum TaxID=405751 RepID=A0A7T0Q534_9EUKA|nr:ATP synthase subunit a [Pleurostomum flabellatum]QPL15610.1 ATP synthase subunit a [Pleurostomum flabellatum]